MRIGARRILLLTVVLGSLITASALLPGTEWMAVLRFRFMSREDQLKAVAWLKKEDQEAQAVIRYALAADDPELRDRAAYAVRVCDLRSLCPALRKVAISDPDGRVRETAVYSLSMMGWEELSPIKDEAALTKGAVLYAFVAEVASHSRTEPEAYNQLLKLARDPKPEVRRYTMVQAVGDFSGERLWELAAIGISDPEPAVRAATREYLWSEDVQKAEELARSRGWIRKGQLGLSAGGAVE